MDPTAIRESLLAVASNHRWTWSTEATELLGVLPGADAGNHPVRTILDADDAALAAVADASFRERLERQVHATRGLSDQIPNPPEVAYFSPEFGLTDVVPQYSGGLGILAGDHLKAASDLGVSLCGVGLFYRGGFFRQGLVRGKQSERYERYEPSDLGCQDTGIEVSVPFGDRDVAARVWRLEVGRVAMVLLDTDVAANTPADRAITDRLYSGDRRHRLEQELILGIGGARALVAMGWDASVLHLNEGHAGFLILDLLDRQIRGGAELAGALRAIRDRLVFTTHTPVPAGIDRFDLDLVSSYLTSWAVRWSTPLADVLALGSDPTDVPAAFNMAALCLRAAGRANGVSKLHGDVSRQLFSEVPGGTEIGSVTNGVHARTWVMPRLQEAFDDALGAGWENGDLQAWNNVDQLDDETIRGLRRGGAHDLAALVAERTDATIEPDGLIVGFARRFATYKRANLLLRQRQALAALLADDERRIQFVFAGKAHPADVPGKALLAEVVAYAGTAEARGRFIFIPDYDIAVARAMYAGSDVWLNNPVRPREASGTSGEKSALNGGLNCSISDGWWDEMADGRNGWTIPASAHTDEAARDDEEAAAIIDLLSTEILPEYHQGGSPWSSEWLQRIRHNWRSLGPQVTAARMVHDYQQQLYQPALAAARS